MGWDNPVANLLDWAVCALPEAVMNAIWLRTKLALTIRVITFLPQPVPRPKALRAESLQQELLSWILLLVIQEVSVEDISAQSVARFGLFTEQLGHG